MIRLTKRNAGKPKRKRPAPKLPLTDQMCRDAVSDIGPRHAMNAKIWQIDLDVKPTENSVGTGNSLLAGIIKTKQKAIQRRFSSHTTKVALARYQCKPFPANKITIYRVYPSAGFDSDDLAASLKSVRDGIADGLGLPNDRDSDTLQWRYGNLRCPRGHCGVIVVLEEIK